MGDFEQREKYRVSDYGLAFDGIGDPVFEIILTSPRYFWRKLPAHGYRKCRQSGWIKRLLFSKYRGLIFVVLLGLTIGCGNHEDKQSEIRKKVIAGEYEEAATLAQKYFGDDKRILLVTLEYIAVQKNKALKEAYRKHLTIENLNWSTDRSGVTKVAGRLLNSGNKTITGFGIKAACTREGKVVREARARWISEIGPGVYEDFECTVEGLGDCDDLRATVEDLGLKD